MPRDNDLIQNLYIKYLCLWVMSLKFVYACKYLEFSIFSHDENVPFP